MVDRAVTYFFTEMDRRLPGTWLGSRRPHPIRGNGEVLGTFEAMDIMMTDRLRERLSSVRDIEELLEAFAIKSIRLDSQMGLLGWLNGTYQLRGRFEIPSPREMLDIQCQGERFVTLLLAEEDRDRPLGRHAGAFEFFLHDLEHAHKFFGDPEIHRAQTSFFRFLRSSLHHFEPLLGDELFVKDLNYLMSDMNSHPLHLFKYLKAIVLTTTLRRTQSHEADLGEFWSSVLAEWPEEVLRSALRVNQPGLESPADSLTVSGYFVTL